jgi:hypothetical protein
MIFVYSLHDIAIVKELELKLRNPHGVEIEYLQGLYIYV